VDVEQLQPGAPDPVRGGWVRAGRGGPLGRWVGRTLAGTIWIVWTDQDHPTSPIWTADDQARFDEQATRLDLLAR
jgi:hypothetical protein